MTFVLEQGAMVALLYYPSVREHDDIVGVLNRGKAVSYHQHSSDVHHLFERILNEHLGLGVDVGGRLVENHDGGLMDDRSCKADQLSLSCGEVVSAFSYDLVKSSRELVYKAVGVDVFAGCVYLVVIDVVKSEDYIGTDSSRKEKYVLKHLTEVTAQGADLDLFDVDAVDQDLALLYVVIAADEREDRGLTRAR